MEIANVADIVTDSQVGVLLEITDIDLTNEVANE